MVKSKENKKAFKILKRKVTKDIELMEFFISDKLPKLEPRNKYYET
jgi:hypothetical protein